MPKAKQARSKHQWCDDCGIGLERWSRWVCQDCAKGRALERNRVRDSQIGQKRECKACGATFTVNIQGKKYCTARCSRIGGRKPGRVCAFYDCQNMILATNKKHCRPIHPVGPMHRPTRAKRAYHPPTMTPGECATCGTWFMKKSNRQQHCGPRCAPSAQNTMTMRDLPKGQRSPAWCKYSDRQRFRRSKPFIYWHVDHIVPLRGEHVSGLEVLNNLQYLPPWLNEVKSNKFTPQWEIFRPDLLS